jgi:hypothetical protein
MGRLTPLLPKHQPGSPRTIIRAIKVNRPHAIPVLNLIIQAPRLRRNPRIGNHDVQAAKVAHDVCDALLDGGVVFDGDLVGEDFDVEVGRDGRGELRGGFRVVVPEGYLHAPVC